MRSLLPISRILSRRSCSAGREVNCVNLPTWHVLAAATIHRPKPRLIALTAFVDANLGAPAEPGNDIHQTKLAATPRAVTRAVFFHGTCAHSSSSTHKI
jgi:hypothetical protein